MFEVGHGVLFAQLEATDCAVGSALAAEEMFGRIDEKVI
jgi:hypothetical protein